MKKKLLPVLALALALLLIALAVLNLCFRRITVASCGQFVDECPRFARPGREVTVTTAVVSDAEL